jgi:gluconate 2-dehydrogenase gamma chain
MTERSGSKGDLTRREALTALAVIPVAAALDRGTLLAHARAYFAGQAALAPAAPRFFTPHEWRTVRMLVDYLIPRDDRSGSATDAGVPEFIDFMMMDRPELQTPIRGGIGWLDSYSRDAYGVAFADCAPADRLHVLDAIALPQHAAPAVGPGAAFFSQLRDLTASGFWSSPMGVKDLQYLGNTVVAQWTGCPQAALDKLRVNY